MSCIRKQLIVSYSAEQMYDLVYDVNSYSSFIPLCVESEVYEEQGNSSKAMMRIAKGGIGFQITTINTLEKGRSIAINLEKGPFRSLQGIWQFVPQNQQRCMISLHFEFEFTNYLLELALGSVFKQVCESMVDCFHKQAAIRYR